ncbi:MAG: heme exporter protein CcmD [Acidiferrobacterales bacterium]
MSWSEFFAMGGYGLYVWSAYGFVAVVLIINVIIPMRRRSTVMKILRRLSRAEPVR